MRRHVNRVPGRCAGSDPRILSGDSTPTSPDKDPRVDTPLFPSHPAMEPPAIRPGVPSWQEERNVINPDRDHCLNAACGQQAVTEKKLRGHNPKNQEHE